MNVLIDTIDPDDLGELADFHDAGHGTADDFLADMLNGLRQAQKEISCKYFYDKRGSALFDEICDLEEYYPTRTELSILATRAPEIASLAGPAAHLVEFGSGSSSKVRLLLNAMEAPSSYVAVDISRDHLIASTRDLASEYLDIDVVPVCADYTREFELPTGLQGKNVTGFFPGSTIGNFAPEQAATFLGRWAKVLGSGAGLVIGVDLKKPRALLEAAYNDARGVTAEFNENLLVRANTELNADFDLSAFAHDARWNEAAGRIEMHLVSQRDQTVNIADQAFNFQADETIHTENSHKYGLAEFTDMAGRAGWDAPATWTDPNNLFSVHFLRAR
ncbi:MAG: L-histidine N(alpha)-methyltransferase [Alphaproteobacteria bacterium]|nr:L-histidine N(alpha)-methyltransferase [Alphaproteobacteria bacterium]